MKIRLFSLLCWMLITASGRAVSYQVNTYGLVANQVNYPGGNTLLNVFGTQLPDYSMVAFWSCTDADPFTNSMEFSRAWTYYYYDSDGGFFPPIDSWFDANLDPVNPTNIFVNPGEGLFIIPSGEPYTFTFNGDPNVPMLPATLPCGCDHFNLLSRQTNDLGNYENTTGLAPAEGAKVLHWDGSGYISYTFSNGLWFHGQPTQAVGEATFFFVPCCPVFPPPPNIVARSCTNLPVNYAPTVTSGCGSVTVVCTPPSGSLFVPGTTTPVHCVATDTNGHTASRDFTVTVTGPALTIANMNSITWTGSGVLQQADQLNGPWTDVPGGEVSPCPISAGAEARFFRVRCD